MRKGCVAKELMKELALPSPFHMRAPVVQAIQNNVSRKNTKIHSMLPVK